MTKPRRLEYRSATAPAREKRAGLAGELELRSDDKGKPLVVGYAAKWDKLSRPVGGLYQEKVQRGAFARSLRQVAAGELDLVATENHDGSHVLGRTSNGTLKVYEDEVGLRFEVQPPETTWAADMLVQLKRKDHTGCSFAFECGKDGQRWDFGAGDGGKDVRTLVEVDLAEVAVVTFPQYDDTSVALEYRSQAKEGSMPTPRETASRRLDARGYPRRKPWDARRDAEWAKAHPGESRSCFHGHLGVYLMHPQELTDTVAMIRAGVLQPVQATVDADAEEKRRLPYELTDRGVAVVRITGSLKKEASKYGGTGTVRTQRTLKAALRNAEVRSILLVVDSPGGHVDGTKELADLVAAADQVKPVHAYGEDMVASAAYWIACQARRVTGNATGQWGSIGAVGVLHDSTGAYEKQGVQVHVVATGALKGAGTPGTPITEEHLAEVGEYVHAVHSFFQDAVMRGRRMSAEAVEAVSDGRVWIAAKAVQLGLVDKVETYEAALEACAVAGEQGAAELGLQPGAPVGMTLADAARRQRQAQAGTLGLENLSERVANLRGLSAEQATVLEILAGEPDEEPEDPEAEDQDDEDPALADPLDEDPDAEEEEPEGDPDDLDEHPELGASADAWRQQRQARAMDDEEPEDPDDADPTLEEEDELAEGTEDDEEPAAENQDDEGLEGDDQEEELEDDDQPEPEADDDELPDEELEDDDQEEELEDDDQPEPEADDDELPDEELEDDDPEPDAEDDDDPDVDAEDDDEEPEANVDPSLDPEREGHPQAQAGELVEGDEDPLKAAERLARQHDAQLRS